MGLFYERDCQGQTSPFLMTQSFFPGQSALTSPPNSRFCAACFGVGQSSSSSLPCRLNGLTDPNWTNTKRLGSRDANHGSI